MKKTLITQLIAFVIAALMLFPSAVFAEGISILDLQKASESSRDSEELTELDRALNAEGSSLHFETGGEFPFEISAWDEPDEVIAAYGERTVAKAEYAPSDMIMDLVEISYIFYSGNTLTEQEYYSIEHTAFEENALQPKYIDGEWRYPCLRLDNTGEIPWEAAYINEIYRGVVNGNYGQNKELDASASEFNTVVEHMVAGEYLRFNYTPRCREGQDYFRFFINDELVLESSDCLSQQIEYVFTCPEDGRYQFRWEFTRGAFDNYDGQSIVSSTVDVDAGDALVWDWALTNHWIQSIDYSLYVDGEKVKTAVHTDDKSACSIQGDMYVFQTGGSHSIEWHTYIEPHFNDYHIAMGILFDPGLNITVLLDEVHVIPAASVETSTAELNTALNESGGELRFLSTGRLHWIASEFNGEPCAVIGTDAGDSGEELTNYTAKLETSVYLREGWTFSYKEYLNYNASVVYSCVLVNGVRLCRPVLHEWFSSLGTAGILPGIGGYGIFTFTAPKSDYYTFTFVVCKAELAKNNLRLFDMKIEMVEPGEYESSPYLNSALNKDGGTLEFFCPGISWVNEHDQYVPTVDYAASVMDGQYVCVNTNQDEHFYTGYSYDYFPSSVCTYVYMSEGAELSFDYRISSEIFDELQLWVNDVLQPDFISGATYHSVFSGATEWQTYTWTAPENGYYTIRWTYLKDWSISLGNDSAWLDNVELAGVVPREGEEPEDEATIYPQELAEAISSPVNVLFATESEKGWTAGEGCAVSGEVEGSWTETELFIDINTEVRFDYALTGGVLKAYIIHDDGQVVTMLSAEESCDFTEFRYTPPTNGVYTIRFEHSGAGEASVKRFTLLQSKSQAKPATQEQLDAALNAEGGELTFTTWGNYPMYVGTIDGRTFAGNSNAGVDASESIVKTTAQLEEGQILIFDAILNCGSAVDSNDYDMALFIVYKGNAMISFETVMATPSWTSHSYDPSDAGTYTFVWVYFKDRHDATAGDIFRLDNVHISSLNDIHEYDGKLYGSSAGMWYGYDIADDTVEEIIPAAYSTLGITMLSAAYVPESGMVYGFLWNGQASYPVVYYGNELIPLFDGYGVDFMIPVDLTYDPSEGKIYCISFRSGHASLYEIPTDNYMNPIYICDIDSELSEGTEDPYYIMTIAACPDGELYLTDSRGNLFVLEKGTMELNYIGNTGLANPNGYFQSMTYDPVAEKLYLSYYDGTDGAIYEIDRFTAEATLLMDGVGQVTSLFTYAPAPEPQITGDADGSGAVDALDALLVLRYTLGLVDSIDLPNADVDGDGTVTATDALIILRAAMGILTL